jgi:Spy/CpxP family protein refolding chaperone
MQGSKHLALMFLLGATLVGGVLGFSADRLLVSERLCSDAGDRGSWRARFDEALELTPTQRAAVDTILDVKHRQVTALLESVQPQLDSVREHARGDIRRILSPEQQVRFEQWHNETMARKKGRAVQ